jgi:hypothetical protein
MNIRLVTNRFANRDKRSQRLAKRLGSFGAVLADAPKGGFGLSFFPPSAPSEKVSKVP